MRTRWTITCDCCGATHTPDHYERCHETGAVITKDFDGAMHYYCRHSCWETGYKTRPADNPFDEEIKEEKPKPYVPNWDSLEGEYR